MVRAMRHLAIILTAVLLAAACRAEIGDACAYDIDCSPNMNRNCDSTQPGGYCLVIGCDPDECPNEAVCVEFTTPCPDGPGIDEDGGVEYEEMCNQIEPNRGRTYCLRHCKTDKGCRSSYSCMLPVDLNAVVIDLEHTDSTLGVCVPYIEYEK